MPNFKQLLMILPGILLLGAPAPAADDAAMVCDLSEAGRVSSRSAPLRDGGAAVKITDAPSAFDASLAPGSFIFMVNDTKKKKRIAFTGSPLVVAPEGASLGSSDLNLSCRKEIHGNHVHPSRPQVELPNYLMCMLDETLIEGGVAVSTKREIISQNSSHNFRQRQVIEEESKSYAFSVNYLSFDPVSGLDVSITDKVTGETARFVGPGQSMVTSFMMALTQGDRSANAKFLRLGCVYTADPALFGSAQK